MADKALKTCVFVWEGTDKKGAKVKGELAGQNTMLVKAQLRKQGINPLKVRKKGITLLGKGKRVKPMDIGTIYSSDGNHDGCWGSSLAIVRHNFRRFRQSQHA